MSEENNLETNFLCAPEDAFEDFQLQAGAACEEEEFITLSDLVPPPPVVPDIPSDLGDIPFDNEIELSTSVEEQLRGENSIEPIPNHDEPASSDSASVAQPVINDATTNSIVEETPVNSGRPKRERKKNIYLESLSSGNRRKKSNGDSNPRPRRGRKQANTQNEVELNGSDVAESLLPYNTPDSTPTPKRGRRKKTDNVISDLEQPVVSKKSPGKRGRRKKAADVLSETLDSNNVLNEFNEEANDYKSQEITKAAEKKPGRRGRRSKKEWTELMTTTSMVTVSQENDINTFSVTPNPDNVENALNELFGTNNSDNFDTPKTEDGTSTTSKDLTHALEHSEADINESIDNQKTLSDDDEDDVCLSMLSQKKSDHEIDKQPDQSCEPTNIETNGETVKIEMVPNSDDIVVDDCDQELPAQDNIEEKVKLEPIPNTEYNVDNTDSIVKENDGIDQNNSLLVEDCTKRPARRRTKKELHYEEESDEDPFANMELSDDDEPKRRKRRYNSDDEYVPELEECKTKRGKKRAIDSDTDSEELDLEDLEIDNKQKRKRNSRSGEAKSPKKKIKNDSTAATSLNVTTIAPSVHTIEDDDDIEVALQSSVIQAPEDSNIKLGWSHSGTDEFESFLANKGDLKIKKVSSAEIPQNTPLEIPILVPKAKRLAEASTQTSKTSTANTEMQTDTPYDIPMEKNISLTADQSKNACDFLQSIIKTTSELGQLMTQKSEDFLTKKINTKHVDDTFKMDYCVQKSFLLLKLAKSNLFQMEADLSKQYEEFLQKNNLAWCRQEVKKIVPSAKPPDSDSDCEIIEDTASVQKNSEKNKSKFNPKTVFLNKELSIKIAKKPTPAAKPMKTSSKGKLNLKGKQEVWISNSVMVKKVKPTQSFLAQDSRNKKPPDQQYVTEKMVSDFFLNHQRQQALKVCAPFTSPEWVHRSLTLTSVCGYFFVKPYNTHLGSTSNFNQSNTPEDENNEPENLKRLLLNPPSLTSICTKLLQQHMQKKNFDTNGHQSPVDKDDCDKVHTRIMSNPPSLASICTTVVEQHILQEINLITAAHPISVTNENKNPASLFRLCLKTLNKIYQADQTNVKRSLKNDSQDCLAVKSPAELFELSLKVLTNTKQESIKEDHTPDGILYNDFSENGTFSPGKDEANLDMSEKPDSIDEDHISDDKLSDDLSDNGTFSHGKDETGLDMSDDEHFNFNYLDEISSHTSYPRCVEIGTEIKNLQNLKTLCFNKIRDMIGVNGPKTIEVSSTDLSESALEQQDKLEQKRIQFSENKQAEQIIKLKNGMKSLFTLCFEQIKDCQNSPRIVEDNKHEIGRFGPQSLKNITLQNIQNLLFEKLAENEPQPQSANCIFEDISFTNSTVKTLSNICFEAVSMLTRASSDIPTGLTINSVNTLSEEAFHNIEDCDEDGEENSPYEDEGDFCNEESYQEEIDENECRSNEDSSWATQVQMQELTSCLLSSIENNEMQRENEIDNVTDDSSLIAQVKLEPVDFTEATQECVDQGTTFIKTESVPPLDEMLNIPDNIVAKQEFPEEPRIAGHLQRQNSFDVNSFEQFVATNKLMHPLDDDDDGIFSQSALRVRRQHDPDYVNEYDPSMGLLIPQTFEPMNIETVKGSLMESSSDDENNSNKSVVKKKPERRGRPKKTKPEIQAKKDTVPNKSTPQVAPVNEVAILTRKMREKIRQEQKKIQSSDSESEDSLPLNVKKGKDKKADSAKSNSHDDSVQEEIQCNDIDSTEQVETQTDKGDSDSLTSFSGFSAVDQNEITSYHKYMKFVYDKIMPKVSETSPKEDSLVENILPNTEEASNSRPESPLINYDDPVEMLECEPTMPDFDETDLQGKQTRRSAAKRNKTQLAKPKSAPESQKDAKAVPEHDAKLDKTKETSTEQQSDATEQEYTERNGWKCYPITGNDIKLCQKPMLILEKLPESFVDTYFQYQNISNIHDEDHEVEKLINLNTISKSASSREGNAKLKVKSKSGIESLITFEGSDVNLATSPTFTDPECNEFSPSEDEGANIDEAPLVATKKDSENNLAKNSLMDDSDSDAPISKIGQGINEDEPILKSKTKSKTTVKLEDPENLTLTADKMMQKELNLLHAPVTMNDDEVPETSKGSHKSKKKYGTRNSSMRDRAKGDDDSSSDEEKQWVNTKEKLLKRLEKKHDTTIMDDAKRTKLVNEFIVRREEGKGHKKHTQRMGKKKIRATKKRLEREKQLRILSHELYGEPIHTAKGSQNLFKGRRNIRKVIDKKSLQRSTVIANMEEFERKRRLALKQAKLRELLGYEESVNVLVINDEVCLEYDLELQEPVVTVHSFFTKVMKAHQYEGVKFMWDACFESLATVASGAPGGGCILAHCMGLGKTLQVLALLHTVLTHPQVNMQRVLVCCPLSTVLNWVDEIHKWITPVTNEIKVFELSKLKKTYERAYQLEDWYTRGGIFIIGYELFRSLTTLDAELDDVRPTIVNKIRTALLDPGPDIIVCDEGHLLKNDCSVLALAMSRVATKRRIVLTGTPMQNNLREYYCMVNFIKPNLLGTYAEYSNRFENPIMNGQHRDSIEEDIKLMKERTHILHKVLEGCLQRQEASVLYPYLPKKHEYTLFISLTPVQWELYKHYVGNYTSQVKHSVLKDFHILQKIWSHPQVLHNFQNKTRDHSKVKAEKLEDDLAHADMSAKEDIKPDDIKMGQDSWWLHYLEGGNMLESLDSSNKFVVVFRILEECIALGDKVLIFSTSLFTMDSMEYFLKKINKWSLGQEYYRLDGCVPAEVRQKWCREFNAENNVKTKLFLISTRAGSLGLNLVAANRVILLDTSWNPAHDIQSIFRVYRFGQKKDCYIYRLVAMGTMEQKIYERSVTKQAVACRVVDEQQIERHYNMAELTELYRFDETGVGVAGGVAAGVRDVALLRVARLPALHAVHEHDSLLRGEAEPQLAEHERAMAWIQFQEEHQHKQMQNHLTSSFALHNTPINAPMKPEQGEPLPDVPAIPESSHLLQYPQVPQPPEEKKETKVYKSKTKKGRPPIKLTIPLSSITPKPERNEDAKSVEDGMVNKISQILTDYNVQNLPTAEINKLIGDVRKMVAIGHVKKSGFNDKLTQTIANVLLGKEPGPQPSTSSTPEIETVAEVDTKPRGRGRPRSAVQSPKIVSPSEGDTVRKRGRPRKDQQVPRPESPKETIVSDLVEPECPGDRMRRKAAIAAQEQLDRTEEGRLSRKTVLQGQIDTEVDTIDLGDEGDWQGAASDDDYAPEQDLLVPIPEKPKEKPRPKSKKSKASDSAQTESSAQKELTSDINSILLSDDDEPVQKKNKNDAPAVDTTPVPLHPSLLTNKNFIKIIAHTYLEGNKMLTEDAATLAAQYSALKAQQEFESTGKPIDSGPIYDIAVKVLGTGILKKLHKPNLKKPKIEPQTIKVETPEPVRGRIKAKGIKELTGPAPTVTPQETRAGKAEAVEEKLTRPEERPIRLEERPMLLEERPSRTRRVNQLSFTKLTATGMATSAAGSTETTASPAVVPIGMFARAAGSIPQNAQITTLPKEESILPDDDDVICSDTPEPARPPPVILNSLLAGAQRVVPKIKISGGKIVLANSPTITPNAQPKTMVPATSNQDTICLDSDEEAPPDPPPKPAHKRPVALKSTSKRQAPVPVQLTAANMVNPALTSNLAPTPHPLTLSQGSLNFQAAPGANYVVIPAAQAGNLTRLPPGVVPSAKNIPRLIIGSQNNVFQIQPDMTTAVPASNFQNTQNMTLLNQYQTADNIYQIPTQKAFAQNPNIVYSTAPNVNSPPALAPLSTNANSLLKAPKNTPEATEKTGSKKGSAKKPGPASKTAASQNKTVCKPGDILRITKTGQVEILNRDVEDRIVGGPVSKAPSKPSNELQTFVHLSDDDDEAPKAKEASKTKAKPAKRAGRPKKVLSSSSSSSDSSRPATPTDSDPLSILKDVVHIQASDDPVVATPQRKPMDKIIGSTFITKSSNKHTPSKPLNTKDHLRIEKVTPGKESQNKKDKIIEQINKTNTVLKKLNDVLGPASERKKKINSTTINLDSVDLTKSSPSTTKGTTSTSKGSTSTTKGNTIATKGSASTSSSKVLNKFSNSKDIKVAKPTKLVGTSKNIILTGSGKAALLKDAPAKKIHVTSVEKVAPAQPTRLDPKKRTATATSSSIAAAAKKKKIDSTINDLRFFNCDDDDDEEPNIDMNIDIIELE